MDTSTNFSLLWYIIGITAIFAKLGYIGLHYITKEKFTPIEKQSNSLS